jgi:hypothetical protein
MVSRAHDAKVLVTAPRSLKTIGRFLEVLAQSLERSIVFTTIGFFLLLF